MSRRLVVHIGLEKTGTSSLQACLHHNHALLRRHSILYPRRNLAYGWMNHKPLVGCYAIDDGGDRWLEVDPSRKSALVGSLIGEIEVAPQRTAVISAEHLSSRFREEHIRELSDDFERFDCRIVIVLRDHLSRLYSSYDTYVTNGGTLPLDVFAEGVLRPEALDLRYADLIAPWERVFGRDRLKLIAYGPDVIRRVLASLAPGLGEEIGPRSFRHKISAGADVIAALRLSNATATRPTPASRVAWARETQVRAQVKAWLQQAAHGRPPMPWSLEPSLLARLTEIARSDAARLEERYGFVLGERERSVSDGDVDGAAAELLGRALVGRAAKPWSRASWLGAGFALALALRDSLFVVQRRLAGSLRRRSHRAPLKRDPM